MIDFDRLLYVRHPFEQQHHNQMEALTNAAEGFREELAQTFRFGNASYLYYYEQDSDPTEEDYQEWLTGLPENIRALESKAGYAASMKSLSLRRHGLERRDLGMSEYLKKVLNHTDWEEHQKISNGL